MSALLVGDVSAAVRAQVPRAGAGGERGPVQAHVGQVQARAPVPLLRRHQRRRQVSTLPSASPCVATCV